MPAGESGGEVTAVQSATSAAADETAVAVAEAPATPSVRLRPMLQPAAPIPAPAPQPASDKPLANAVKPSAPPLFVADSPPAAPAPAAPPPPPAPAADASTAAVAGDPGKFKLKPKVPGAPVAGSPPVPPLFLPADAPVSPPGLSPRPSTPEPGASSRSSRAPSPVPIPHVKVEGAELAPEVDIVVKLPQSGRGKQAFVVIALLAAAGYGVYLAWPHLPAEFSVSGYTVRTKPGFTISKAKVAPPVSLPTPSEALNKLAHMPGNAIDKAQGALSARRASGQDRVDAAAVGEDLPGRSLGVPPAAPIKPPPPPPKAPAAPTAATTVAPGMSAPVSVEAAPEAAPEFRAFVTNARISGIFQGNPARAVINGKLSRAGEVVDPGLGITFEGLDDGRKNLVFKDRSGAKVTRRF